MYMHIYVYFNYSVILSHINHLIFIVKDWMQIVEGIPNATAIQLNVMDHESLFKYISQVDSFPWYILNSYLSDVSAIT
jgi:hypothetical protein